MFGRATIRLGIGPHSSYQLIFGSQWRYTIKMESENRVDLYVNSFSCAGVAQVRWLRNTGEV